MTDTTIDEATIAWLLSPWKEDAAHEASCWRLYPHTLVRIPTGLTFDVVTTSAEHTTVLLERLASYDMGAVPVASTADTVSVLATPGTTGPFKREGRLVNVFPNLVPVTLLGKGDDWFAPPLRPTGQEKWLIPPSASPFLPQASSILAALTASTSTLIPGR